MKKMLILYVLGLSSFLASLSQTIITPILPDMVNQLNTSYYWINMSISIFMFISAMMQIVYGPLVDNKGRRKIAIPTMILFIIASIGCAFSMNVYMLLLFRALQAVGIAATSVVAATVIGDLFEGSVRGKAMGTYQMFLALGPIIGPTLGGIIGGYVGVFILLAAMGLALVLATARFLPETRPEGAVGKRFGVRSFVKIMGNRTGSAMLLIGFTQYFAFYNFLVFLPNILNYNYGLDSKQIGFVFLPMSVLLMFGSFLGGRIQTKIAPRKSLIIACLWNLMMVIGFICLASVSLTLLMITTALYGLTAGISMPMQTTILAEEFVLDRATAVGVYNFIRFVGMALGPVVGGLLYSDGSFGWLFGLSALLFGMGIWFGGTKLKTRNLSDGLNLE
ncbi:MFS transporter [Paenibacillus tyrfis]|uniref:MFS transporter n=1 Tax=Paenibacillus tyrfis TaxID=1501230 RepID=UPI000689C3CB|nr:MFS transporter [Paenibacillus tyrfis]